jgi:hypothetical protein
MGNYNDLTVEELRSQFFDEEALRLPPVRLWRMEARGIRVYYTFDDGEIEIYPGVTGMLSKVLPTSEELIKWRCQMGYDESIEYMRERANYGSLMHALFVPLSVEGKINLDMIREGTIQWCEKNGIPYVEDWPRELKLDLLAYAQFMIDYQVKPIAIEVPLRTKKYHAATMVDMFCRMVIPRNGFWGETYKSGEKKGQPKQTKKDVVTYAVVDFKSRRKAYVTEADELQLEFGKQMILENYPEFRDEDIALFSWHPKEWRTSPGYHFTEHTDKHSTEYLRLLKLMYQQRNDLTDYIHIKTSGIIDISKGDLSGNVENIPLIEIINGKSNRI